jgi:hypothetical protein
MSLRFPVIDALFRYLDAIVQLVDDWYAFLSPLLCARFFGLSFLLSSTGIQIIICSGNLSSVIRWV